jgi:spermidine synthase
VLVGQAGCATLWRNETLLRSTRRFGSVFPTVLHYGSDEHEWSFLTGSASVITDPLARMTRRLPSLPYRPRSLDAEALRRGAVLPFSARHLG